jgi:hypothetical protein
VVDWIQQSPLEGRCEYSDEPSGSIKAIYNYYNYNWLFYLTETDVKFKCGSHLIISSI